MIELRWVVPDNTTTTLTPEEINSITQHRRLRDQLTELREQGFWRARLGRKGIILETAHYEAVCAGALPPGTVRQDNRPKVRIGK